MSPRESSLEDRQREEPSTGASALPSELQLYVLLHRFFLSVLFFLRQFATFLFTLLSLSIGRRIRTVLTTWFGTAAPWPSLLLSYSATNRRYCKLIYCHYFWMDFRHTCACRCMTHYNWTNESELKRDSFPEHSAVFVFQVFPKTYSFRRLRQRESCCCSLSEALQYLFEVLIFLPAFWGNIFLEMLWANAALRQ